MSTFHWRTCPHTAKMPRQLVRAPSVPEGKFAFGASVGARRTTIRSRLDMLLCVDPSRLAGVERLTDDGQLGAFRGTNERSCVKAPRGPQAIRQSMKPVRSNPRKHLLGLAPQFQPKSESAL